MFGGSIALLLYLLILHYSPIKFNSNSKSPNPKLKTHLRYLFKTMLSNEQAAKELTVMKKNLDKISGSLQKSFKTVKTAALILEKV